MASGYIDLTLGEKALTSFQDIDMREFAQHLKEKEKEWNSAFQEHEATSKLRFCAQDAIKIAKEMPHMLMGRVPIVEWLKGDQEGTVWDTQIRTTVDILNSTLVNPGQSGVCIGPTMCGKTGTANNCQFLAPILSMMTGIPHLMINLLPNKKSIEDQAKDDWRRFLAFYDTCKIIYGKKELTLASFYGTISNGTPLEGLYPLNDDRRNTSKGNIHRRSKAVLAVLNQYEDYRRKCGFQYIYLTDELHQGANKDSIQSSIYEQFTEALLENGKGDIIIGFSATPWQMSNLSEVWKVGHKLSKNYVGLNFFNGEPIDPDVENKRPVVMSTIEFASQVKPRVDFSNVSRCVFLNEEKFYKQRDSQFDRIDRGKDLKEYEVDLMGFVSHEDYRKYCLENLVKSINWCLVKGKPCGDAGQGLMLRFCTNNKDVEEFSQLLREYGLHKKIKILQYTAKNVKQKVHKFIMDDEHVREDKPYIILLTGSGRMADRFPANLKFYFDFTEESNDTAIIQGSHGRATGNGKGDPLPWVILRPKVADHLKAFIQRKGVPFKKPHVHTFIKRDKNGQPLKTKSTTSITWLKPDKDTADPVLLNAWNKFERRVAHTIPVNTKQLRGGWYPGVWEDILSEDVLCKIESLYGEKVEILRPGELDDGDGDPSKGWGWAIHPKNKSSCKIGLRKAKGPSSRNSNLVSDRDLPGGEDRDLKQRYRLEVQAHCHPPSERRTKWCLVGVRLRLRKRATILADGGTVLPTEKTFWQRYATEEERNEIIGAQ